MLTARNEAAHRRVWRPGRPVDLHATLAPMRRGSGDPAYQVDSQGAIWRAVRTPSGSATTRLQVAARDAAVHATAWGAGAEAALESLPELLGARDCSDGFRPAHPLLCEMWRRHPGWRVPRSGLVLEALVPAVLEQKVTGTEARRAWRYLLRRHGEPAPGPARVLPPRLCVPLAPEVLRAIPSWEWHRAGVDQSRSAAVVRAAARAGRLEQASGLPGAAARERLEAVHGIGRWTSAEVAQRAFGDADAVSVGDFHLASIVRWALVGQRADDDVMLELLEPYRGHRYRAVRLIELSLLRPPRHGPRLAPREHRHR